MVLVYVLTAILQSLHIPEAVLLWHWFGSHVLLTILMLIFLA